MYTESAYVLKCLDGQPRDDTLAVAAAHEIRRLLSVLRSRDQDIAAINRDVARLRAGIPDGVTAEEWEILRELRRLAPKGEDVPLGQPLTQKEAASWR